jgi:putative acetyltransferase
MNIRRAQKDDCQDIRGVHIASVMGISTDSYTPEEIQAWAIPKDPKNYEDSIGSKEFLVAEDNSVILGFGVLNQERAEIEAVYVSPEAGRRGIGMALLRKLEERAGVLGLSVLRLNASLNAVPFYERAGYVGQAKSKYRLFSGVEIDCVPMLKAVGQDPGWENLRDHLDQERQRINEEIRDYPRPIPACDAQFNFLLQEQTRIAEELSRLKALAKDAVTESANEKLTD